MITWRIRTYLPYALVALFACWCVIQFRADIEQLSLAPILRAPELVLLATLLSLANYGLRIIRWRMYLAHLGHALPFGFAALTFTAGFAFTLSPGKVGEMVRARYYRDLGIPLSQVAAAFFTERLMDLLAMVTVALLGMVALGSHYRWLLWGTVGAMGVMLFLLASLSWVRLERRLMSLVWLPARLRQAAGGLCRTFASARELLRFELLVLGFGLGVVAWGAEGLGLAVIGGLVPSPSLALPAAMGIYAVAIIVGALSFLPGGLGSTEAAMAALLVSYGFALPDALLLTLVCRLLTLWFAVGLGWLAVLRLRRPGTRSQCGGESADVNTNPVADQDNLHLPLCVDLDGTLLHSDLLLESLLLLVKHHPLDVLRLPAWLFQGKARLKAEIARRVPLNVATLPFNQDFLSWLRTRKAEGQTIWLCTAADGQQAQAVAKHLGVFDGVMASNGQLNLVGPRKAAALVGRFGERGFDYCGNEKKDLAIWARARGAIVVNGSAALASAAARVARLVQVFPAHGHWARAAFRAMRPHQWAKNVLVFVPLLAAHRLADGAAVLASGWAFLAFSLCASSVYLLNDMLDLEADRLHPRKSRRPFAAGRISLLFGFAAVPLLLLGSGLLAFQVSMTLLGCLVGYYLLTLAYSFRLKTIPMLDTLALAGLYTLRIIAGAAAIVVPLSFWLLLFSIFLFLSLALVKRYAELEGMRRRHQLKAFGRGYHMEDLPALLSFGAAAGYLSVLVLALYINTPEVTALYAHPKAIWGLCGLMLYWISRLWMTAHRGQMHDDPLIYALRDRVSLGIGVLAVLTVLAASWV